jgi:potassium-transporting ATPase KdpC subunit
MIRNAVRALIAVVLLAVLTGLVYPLALTAFAQVALRHTTSGNIVESGDRAVGSTEIGQLWTGRQWFYGRPSAIDYDASTSSGSNLGPRSQSLADTIADRAKAIVKLEAPFNTGLSVSQIPADLLTASSSGLDPDISPAAARFEAPRIAAVRGLSPAAVMRLIDEHTYGRTFGFLGAPRVNVLQLNLALQALR